MRCNKLSNRAQLMKGYIPLWKCVELRSNPHAWLLMVATKDSAAGDDYCWAFSQNGGQFFSHFKHLIGATLSDEDQFIGGPGIIVEVDKTKLSRRKYHRGHRVEGAWVVVGVERTTKR